MCFDTEPKEAVLVFKPSKQRSCTDVLFLLLIIVSWVAMAVVFSTAADKGGDPNKILRGVDFNGQICGKDNMKHLPYAAWPEPTYYDIKICVADCEETNTNPLMSRPHNSTLFLYYCLPNFVEGSIKVEVSGDFESASNQASLAMADLFTTWPLILASAGFAVVLSFLYTQMIKYQQCASFLVWMSIALTCAGGALLGYTFLQKAKEADDSELSAERSKAMRGLGIVICVLTFLFALVAIALRSRIALAIKVVSASSGAVGDMKTLLFFPLFPFLFALGYFVFFIAMTLYIFSVTEQVAEEADVCSSDLLYLNCLRPSSQIVADMTRPGMTNVTFIDNKLLKGYQGSFAYVFFHLLWMVQFIIYFTYMVIAGAVANWYFTPSGDDGEKARGDDERQLPHSPVLAAVGRTVRYHLGTIALASLIIAIIQFARAVVTYLEKKSRPAQGEPNALHKMAFCCLKCCLRCFECCMDKVSKNALVWTSIWGDSFVPACCSSFKLLWENLGRVAAINMVSAFLITLGKVLVALASTGIACIIIKFVYKEDVSSIVMPGVVIFILTFVVATIFMVVFETIVDTVFLCYLVDSKINGDDRTMFADAGFKELVKSHAGESAALAQEMHTSREGLSAVKQA